MSTISGNEKALEIRVKEMIMNETRHAIFMAIRTYGSLNIKTLAEILGKTESTIFHHLSIMLEEPKIIEIDIQKTEKSRGKFYQLSKKLVDIYEKEEAKAFTSDIPEVMNKLQNVSEPQIVEMLLGNLRKQPDLGNVAISAKKSLSYEHILENFILNNFEKAEKALLNGFIPLREDFPIGGFSNISIDIKIFNIKQIIQISNIIATFFKELTNLKKEIQEEIKDKNIPEEKVIIEHVHVFSGELGDFQFIKKE
ncbi:MAG: ArsR family transcriptional regulator [Candidatus Thorarchaeota archaeon]